MNQRFLNPFELTDFPEAIEDCIQDGAITVCAFNSQGTMLAAGCSDGRCLVFDYDTRGLACTLFGHRRAITSIRYIYGNIIRHADRLFHIVQLVSLFILLINRWSGWNMYLLGFDAETTLQDIPIRFASLFLLLPSARARDIRGRIVWR
jgi:WD40 repeat protein